MPLCLLAAMRATCVRVLAPMCVPDIKLVGFHKMRCSPLPDKVLNLEDYGVHKHLGVLVKNALKDEYFSDEALAKLKVTRVQFKNYIEMVQSPIGEQDMKNFESASKELETRTVASHIAVTTQESKMDCGRSAVELMCIGLAGYARF